METKEHAAKVAPLAALAMYVVLLGMVLVMAGFGGRLYSRIAQRGDADSAVRTTLGYVAAHLRTNDQENTVSVADGPQGDALILRDGSGYAAKIYAYNGNLVEEYAEADTPLSPENAQIIAPVQQFSVMQEGRSFTVCTERGTVRVTLHTQQGGQP